MGIFDKLLNRKRNNSIENTIQENTYKDRLASQIINLVDSIKKINSLDSSIWNLQNKSSHELSRKSVSELESIKNNLTNRLEMLSRESKQVSQKRQSIEESKWTGKKPDNLSEHDFDRLQRDDER